MAYALSLLNSPFVEAPRTSLSGLRIAIYRDRFAIPQLQAEVRFIDDSLLSVSNYIMLLVN